MINANKFNLIELKHLISEFENLTKMEEASREKMFGSSLVSGAFSIIMHHLRIHSQCGIRPILNSFFMHYISSSQIKFLDQNFPYKCFFFTVKKPFRKTVHSNGQIKQNFRIHYKMKRTRLIENVSQKRVEIIETFQVII